MKLGAALPLVLLALELPASAVVSQDSITSSFRRLRVRLCLKPEFVTNLTKQNLLSCARLCLSRGPRCRGFRLTDEFVCKIFEFDRCDHMLNKAFCDRRDWAYVRAQNDLPIGQLCADGFGHGYLGSTYKMVNISSWTDGLNKCSSEPGELTKYADGNDRAEVDHLRTLKSILNGDLIYYHRSFYVGGRRTMGNWFWYDCGTALLPEVWGAGQPNGYTETNSNDIGRVDVWYSHSYGLDDEEEANPEYIYRALCECVNPFY